MSLSAARIVKLIQEVRSKVNGTIYLPTNSALAIWKHQILGQISDGAWENAAPRGHWEYWSDLDSKLGKPGIKADAFPRKTGYNLAGLIQYVGDELLSLGKMGSVTADEGAWEASWYMPATLEQFKAKKASGESKKIDQVSDGVAEAYYASSYGQRDLMRDLGQIKVAMKSDPFKFVPGEVEPPAGKPSRTANLKAQLARSPTQGNVGSAGAGGRTQRIEKIDPTVNAKKFWQATINGSSVTASWGRIGTAGQSQVKDFGSPSEAASWVDEMIFSKMSNGYRRAAAPAAPSGGGGRATVAAGPSDTGEAGSAPPDQRRSEPRAGATASNSYKVYPGGKDRPPVTRVKGRLYRGPLGSKAKPGSSYKVKPTSDGLSVSGDDWTQDWMPESVQPGPYETHVRCALSGRRRSLPEGLKPTLHNLMMGVKKLDDEVRKQRTNEGWSRNPQVPQLYERLRPYYEAVFGRPMRFKHRDIETVLRAAIRKALREAHGSPLARSRGRSSPPSAEELVQKLRDSRMALRDHEAAAFDALSKGNRGGDNSAYDACLKAAMDRGLV